MGRQPDLLIELEQFCAVHSIERGFLVQLEEVGLIEFEIESTSTPKLSEETVATIERLLRLQADFNLTIEGLEAVFHLSNHIQELKEEIREVKRRLRSYE